MLYLYVRKIDSTEGAMYASDGGSITKVIRIPLTEAQEKMLGDFGPCLILKPDSIQEESQENKA